MPPRQSVYSLDHDADGHEMTHAEKQRTMQAKTAEELFAIADKDNDKTLDFNEFKRLHQVWRNTIEEDIRVEAAQVSKAKRQKARLSVAICVSLLLVFFLVVSCAANAVAVFWIVDDAQTTAAGGTTRGTSALQTRDGTAITTVQSGREVPLGMLPYIARFAPAEAMASMPDYVTIQDPDDWGTMKAYRVQSMSFSQPMALTIDVMSGERFILDGPAKGVVIRSVVNQTDGTSSIQRDNFCAACAQVQLKSVPQSAGFQTSFNTYYRAATELTDEDIHLCATDMQVGRLLALQANVLGRNLDLTSLDHLPGVCSVRADSALLTGPGTEPLVNESAVSRRLAEVGDSEAWEAPNHRLLKHAKDKSKDKSKDKKSKDAKSKADKEDKAKKNKDKKKAYVCGGQYNAWHAGRNGPNADTLANNYKNCKKTTNNPKKFNFFVLDQNEDNCVDLSEMLAVGIFEAWAADTCDGDSDLFETADVVTLWSCCTFHLFANMYPSEQEECVQDDHSDWQTTTNQFCQPDECLSEEEFTLMVGDSAQYVALWKAWKRTSRGSEQWEAIRRTGGLNVPDVAAAEAKCNSVGMSMSGRQLMMVKDGEEMLIPDLTETSTSHDARQRMRMLSHSPACPVADLDWAVYGFNELCNLNTDVNVWHLTNNAACEYQRVMLVVNGGCHPSDTLLEAADGRALRIDQVEAGTLIKTAHGVEPITAVMHAEPAKVMSYFRFHTAVGASVAISEGHFLFVDGVERNPSTIKVGEKLHTKCCGEQPIIKVDSTVEMGRFHITTPSNSYYAGGVLASTYVNFVPQNVWKVAGGLYPQLRHAIGVPITPEGQGPLSIFWPVYAYQLLGLPQPLVDALWPLTMTATLFAELTNTAFVQLPVSAAVLVLGAAASLRASRK